MIDSTTRRAVVVGLAYLLLCLFFYAAWAVRWHERNVREAERIVGTRYLGRVR